MKAEITPNVIQDLLPLYLAGEVSADTAALVEEYLKIDPEMAEIIRQATNNGLLGEVPVPLRKEDAMEAYKHAKQSAAAQTLALAAIIAFTFLCAIVLITPALITALK